ncbi:hypothetical protein P4O66_016517 [Electrophorus voltai]|uniref:Uncharacterized protein n=1 Tax=Electrophorus voltai TaxID=2609070 RepID=A0AAD9DP69_9TELE|nr:hypothetical protein P4O66_016517 [Electrophorus voltai]
MNIKEAIMRLKKKNKTIRDIDQSLVLPKSTVWNAIKKKNHTALLVHRLLQQQIYFVGTLRGNRMSGCQFEDEKSLAKKGRGIC